MWDGTGRPARVVVLGGASEIAGSVLGHLSLPEDAEVVLAGRHRPALEEAAARLPCRVRMESFDALDESGHAATLRRCFAGGDVDLLLVAFGVLGDQERAEADPAHALEVLDVDFRAQASVLLHAAPLMRAQGHGVIVVFSSVAGMRARRPNFVYGSAKAGLDAFASGLADALHGTGVRLVLVRPGFVVGRMTAGMAPAPLSVRPDDVGRAVADALARGRDVVWVPPALRLLAVAMRMTPRALWRRVPR